MELLKRKIFGPVELVKGIKPITVKRKIQELAWENVGVIKNGSGLKEALREIEEIKAEKLPMVYCASKDQIFNREWIEALQVENMIQILEAMTRAALTRTESRGAHYRTDFPNTDNDKWLKNTIVKKMGDQMQVSTEPIVVTKIEPSSGVKPYPGF